MFLYAFALNTAAQSFGLGAKGGMNISGYAGGNMQSKALVGYHIGGMLSFGFGRVLSLQPEVLFSTQGAMVTANGTSERLRTQYITVPVMLKLKASGGFYLEIGPQFAYRSSERIPEQNFGSFTRNLDLSAGLGMGYQSRAGFGFGARYLVGLSRVGDFSGRDISPDFRNSVLQLSLFWMFH